MSEQFAASSEQMDSLAEVDAFGKDLRPFLVAAEATRIPMVFTDAQTYGNPIIFVNDAFLSLTGYSRAEVLGQNFNFLMEYGSETWARLNAAFKDFTSVDSEVRYCRKDGSEFWASVTICPVRDRSGEVAQHFVSFIDLTKHKSQQAQSKMLIGELNHRIKNTLSVVQAIVGQSLRSATDPKEARASIDSRLSALARSHALLTQGNWESAGLLDVVTAAMKPFVADGRAERAVVTGENIRLQADAVLALSIAFNELATNAVKYGAFSNEVGRIAIRWEIVPRMDGDRLYLLWQETGGPPVKPPVRKGFGSRLIMNAVAHQLEATVKLDYAFDGVLCAITFPNRELPSRHETHHSASHGAESRLDPEPAPRPDRVEEAQCGASSSHGLD